MKNRLVLHLPFAVLSFSLITLIWYVCLVDMSEQTTALAGLYILFSYFYCKSCYNIPEIQKANLDTEQELDTSREVFRRGTRAIEDTTVDDNKCQECQTIKSLGSAHCRICQHCYHRHYKHCTSIANCITFSNVRDFFIMLLLLSTLLMTSTAYGFIYVYHYRLNYLKNVPDSVSPNDQLLLIASVILLFLSTCIRFRLMRFLMKITAIIIIMLLFSKYDIKLTYETISDLRVAITTIMAILVLPTVLRNILQALIKTAYWSSVDDGTPTNCTKVAWTFLSLLHRQPSQSSQP